MTRQLTFLKAILIPLALAACLVGMVGCTTLEGTPSSKSAGYRSDLTFLKQNTQKLERSTLCGQC